MNTAVAQKQDVATVVDDVIARGDLSKLTPEQRVVHYNNVCKSLGLNHLTQPFQYITLNGKLQLYARKDATDQLRKINGINLQIPSTTVRDGLLTVHARAVDKSGRSDEDFGVVSIAGLRGEAAANAYMKAVTKAKRRVTLSISGLGFLDESEVESIQPQAFEYNEREATRQEHAALHPSMTQNERSASIEQTATKPAIEDKDPFAIARREDADDAVAWSEWATTLMAYVRGARTTDLINEWITANADELARLQLHDATKYRRLVDMVNHQLAMRAEDDTR